ncbi:hypothetical protein PLESTB_000650700 [Pleodorina starrii]|uniref:Uncharacterized protein n=1 Tax=Pleodorina starrii TaxID=330485 RepID=A0A9W6BJA1_9CHLO|nr:hypothetical protein PLESTB_000650700 [Pleodorina starrii]
MRARAKKGSRLGFGSFRRQVVLGCVAGAKLGFVWRAAAGREAGRMAAAGGLDPSVDAWGRGEKRRRGKQAGRLGRGPKATTAEGCSCAMFARGGPTQSIMIWDTGRGAMKRRHEACWCSQKAALGCTGRGQDV